MRRVDFYRKSLFIILNLFNRWYARFAHVESFINDLTILRFNSTKRFIS